MEILIMGNNWTKIISLKRFLQSFFSSGLGYCLTFLPTVTLLSQYFCKHRSVVTSMASTGESVAIFTFAPGEGH